MECLILMTLFLVPGFNIVVEGSVSDPLILTPLLEAGKYKEAQEKALVVPDIQGVKSYAGYFSVNKECGNNLFFWFTPAEKNWDSAPVLLWLNGGPGCSSLIGMFHEIGPFDFVTGKGLVKRKYRWSQDHNVLYLDQPVGTGFSFSTKNCYAKNMKTIVQEAYKAVVQFFMLFPNLQKNSFFITGESFSGHYIPALASYIDRENKKADLKINLVGVMVGNPYMDEKCSRNAAYMYQLGIIDEKTRDSIAKLEEALTEEINKGDQKKIEEAAGKVNNELSLAVLPNSLNILYDKPTEYDFPSYVRSDETRQLIHVGQRPYEPCNSSVLMDLLEVYYKPAGPYVEDLLQAGKYTVGFYSGQLDLNTLYTSLPCVLRQLKWSGAADYLAANRSQWYVGDRLAGWYKRAGNLFEVVVRNCGHFVPTDQPEAALDLLRAFVADRPGTTVLSKLKTESSKPK